jgi:hypothetical protein
VRARTGPGGRPSGAVGHADVVRRVRAGDVACLAGPAPHRRWSTSSRPLVEPQVPGSIREALDPAARVALARLARTTATRTPWTETTLLEAMEDWDGRTPQ